MPSCAIHRAVGRSISQLLLGPHAPKCLEVPETHRSSLDHLEGVNTPMGAALVLENWAKLINTWGSGEVNILSFY